MKDHLISDGYDSLKELVEDLPQEPVHSAYIELHETCEDIDDHLNCEMINLFHYAADFNGVLGARITWRQLVFFSVSDLSLKSILLPKISYPRDSKISSKAIFEVTIGPPDHRYFRIDSMGMQLSKINYWQKHIYHGYYLNGHYIQL